MSKEWCHADAPTVDAGDGPPASYGELKRYKSHGDRSHVLEPHEQLSQCTFANLYGQLHKQAHKEAQLNRGAFSNSGGQLNLQARKAVQNDFL